MQPKLYSDLAEWWPLVSPPEDYADEARQYAQFLIEACQPTHVLELGSGGGHNALYLKKQFELTLVDLSPQMLAVSQALNPECPHHVGDMRTVRLGRTFDAVFLHDAVNYLTSTTDLARALETARLHCRPGGAVLLVPDCFAETLRPGVCTGGGDGPGRSLRYLEWTYDPDPADTTFEVDFAFLLREGDGPTRVVHDHHTCGLFSQTHWLELCREAGLAAEVRPFRYTVPEPGESRAVLARRSPSPVSA